MLLSIPRQLVVNEGCGPTETREIDWVRHMVADTTGDLHEVWPTYRAHENTPGEQEGLRSRREGNAIDIAIKWNRPEVKQLISHRSWGSQRREMSQGSVRFTTFQRTHYYIGRAPPFKED
jgi:hypothetical protein